MSSAVLFPGHGSHFHGMADAWKDTPRFLAGMRTLGYDPFAQLEWSVRAQHVAVLMCTVAAWENRPPNLPAPRVAAGHSVGEYAALVAAGALDYYDALRVVDARAVAMTQASRRVQGEMLAIIGADLEEAQAIGRASGTAVAQDNAPDYVVLGGPAGALRTAARAARGQNLSVRRLADAGACHTPWMVSAAPALRRVLRDVRIGPCAFPVFSNGTATPFIDVKRELVTNLISPVRFRETLVTIARSQISGFEEIGPARALTALVLRTLPARGTRPARPNPHLAASGVSDVTPYRDMRPCPQPSVAAAD